MHKSRYEAHDPLSTPKPNPKPQTKNLKPKTKNNSPSPKTLNPKPPGERRSARLWGSHPQPVAGGRFRFFLLLFASRVYLYPQTLQNSRL